MDAYPVIVTAQKSMAQAIESFPEMKRAIMNGVVFLAPPHQTPLVNVNKIRLGQVDAPAARRLGL